MSDFIDDRARILAKIAESKGSDLKQDLQRLPPDDSLAKVGLFSQHLGISLQQALDPSLREEDYLKISEGGPENA